MRVTLARASMLVVVMAAGCGRIGYDPPTDALVIEPSHVYHLAGNYDDDLGGPPLVSLGGTLEAGGYRFDGHGLSLTGATPDRAYTIDLVVTLDEVGRWHKLVDFKGRASDTGLYVFEDRLQFVIVPNQTFERSAPVLTTGTPYQLTIAREASGLVTAFIDRVVAFQFQDDGDLAALAAADAPVYFFADDDVTGGGEASVGVVRRIKIFDRPLDEVLLLP